MELSEALAIVSAQFKYNKAATYRPYPWQRDLHAAGVVSSERMSMSANQVGKTFSAAMETTYHLTGEYPEWWIGKRFDEPIIAWIGSQTAELSRDITQAELIGGVEKEVWGTGTIPKRCLISKKMRQTGVSDVIDFAKVRHKSGGVSVCSFKSYDQGWKKWQGKKVHVVWLDEEPCKGEQPDADDYRVYTESQTRIAVNDGTLYVTFTPLNGTTLLVEHFQDEDIKSTFLVNATWDDAPHLTEEKKAELRGSYPDYELEARTKGIPMVGEGRVFRFSDNEIACEPFEIPKYFARICGIDFGMDHPGAAAWLAHDRDTDTIYVYDCYKERNWVTALHAEAIKKRGQWIPVAWPHDGMEKDKKSGQPLYKSFKGHGVSMLSRSARYENDIGGSQAVNPIVDHILERMETGTFKVFKHLAPWFEEFRLLHRKDGVIRPVKDDIMKATFYGVMMRRFATTQPRRTFRQTSSPPLRIGL